MRISTLATAFVLLLTAFARRLGPQLSGLLSPFPVFGVVLAVFTNAQQSPRATAGLLRGVVFGSLSFGVFFMTVGLGLAHLGMGWTYLSASAGAILLSGIFYIKINKNN